jgi:copper resistance protein C
MMTVEGRRPMAGSWVAAGATVLVALLLALPPVAPAMAHAQLVSSTPADGSTVHALPRTGRLSFDEAVSEPVSVSVTDARGQQRAAGRARLHGTVVEQDLSTTRAAEGSYTIAYELVSADGHPVSGTVRFLLEGSGAANLDPAATGSGSSVLWPVLVLVAALLLALALALLRLSRVVRARDDG